MNQSPAGGNGGSGRPQRRARRPSAEAAAEVSAEAEAATRAALLAGALRCVREHGVKGATSRLIAEASGANLAAITYWFGSKDALVAAALFGDLERRTGPVLDRLAGDAPAATRLLTAVRELTAELERSIDDVPVYLDALVLSTGTGALAERGRRLVADLRARLVPVITDLVADGTIAAWVDPEAMASLLIAGANGVALQSRLDPGGPTVAAMAGQLASLLLAASVTSPSSPRNSPNN
jgi:AcrR family transcriptional regulator